MKRLIYSSLIFFGFLGGSVVAAAETVLPQSSRTNVRITIEESSNIVPHSNEVILYQGLTPHNQRSKEPLEILPHTNAINSLVMLLLGINLVMGSCMLNSLKKRGKQMNKHLLKTTAILTMLAGGLSISSSVFAAEHTETNARVAVESGGLSINPLAEINFGTVTKNRQDNTQNDQNGSQLVVNDNRGTTAAGWYLTAKLEDKGEGKTGLDGMTLHLKPAKSKGSSEKGSFATVDLNTSDQTIVSLASTDIDLSAPVTTAELNATLLVPKSISASSYSGVIVWNAVDGAPES